MTRRVREVARLAAVLLVLVSVPAFAAHPIPGPLTYRVQPGSVVLACGGFAFRCELLRLRGTLAVFNAFEDHSGVIDPAIVEADLELVTAGGQVTPFPQDPDLPLTALEGSTDGQRLLFESPAGSFQTSELALTPFVRNLGTVEGLVLDGFYDEGCCDRFRIAFGNVVLRPDSGLAWLDLHGGRFHVVAQWRASGGRGGEGHPVPLDPASGYFWFFQPDNPEVFVKVLDACALTGSYWLFAGGLTNLGVDIFFYDDLVDFAIPVTNNLGQNFSTFVNTVGFPCIAASRSD